MTYGYWLCSRKKYISYSKIHLTRRVLSPLSINIQNSIVKYNFQEMTYWSTNKNKNNYTISIIIIVWERSHFRDLFRAACWSGSGLLRVWNRYWNHFGYYYDYYFSPHTWAFLRDWFFTHCNPRFHSMHLLISASSSSHDRQHQRRSSRDSITNSEIEIYRQKKKPIKGIILVYNGFSNF